MSSSGPFQDIAELIPHRGPAIVIDRVVAHSDQETECSARVESHMQYVVEGRVDAALALELMAQAVAAHVGLQQRWSGEKPRAGYVVGVPKMRFFGGDYSVGDVLSVRVQVVFHDGPVGRFKGVVALGEQTRAEGSLTVFEPSLAPEATQGDEGIHGGRR